MGTLATLDIDRIVDLDTAIGTVGAIDAGMTAGADMFEYIVGLAVVSHRHA